MKKLIYILVLAVVASVSLSSCSEEVVKPKVQGGTGSPIRE